MEYFYAIGGMDLQLFRFKSQEDLNGFLLMNDSFNEFLDVANTDGIDTAKWRPDKDKRSGIEYEWVRACVSV